MDINLRYIIWTARRGVNPHGYLNSTPMNGAAKSSYVLSSKPVLTGLVCPTQPWDLSRGLDCGLIPHINQD
jgi:hypothetical protein